jgi:hypothetical protein
MRSEPGAVEPGASPWPEADPRVEDSTIYSEQIGFTKMETIISVMGLLLALLLSLVV